MGVILAICELISDVEALLVIHALVKRHFPYTLIQLNKMPNED